MALQLEHLGEDARRSPRLEGQESKFEGLRGCSSQGLVVWWVGEVLPVSGRALKKMLSVLTTGIDCHDLKRGTEGRFGARMRCERDMNDSGGWNETSVVCPKTSKTKLSTPNHLITTIGGSQCRSKLKTYTKCLEGQRIPRNIPQGSWMIPKPVQRLSTKVQDRTSEEIAAAHRGLFFLYVCVVYRVYYS